MKSKLDIDSLEQPYDYSSIMHYRRVGHIIKSFNIVKLVLCLSDIIEGEIVT